MYVKVTVHPGAKKETIEQETEGSFIISVREPAERNLANRRAIALLADHYGIPANHIRILTGHRSRSKIVSIDR